MKDRLSELGDDPAPSRGGERRRTFGIRIRGNSILSGKVLEVDGAKRRHHTGL